MVATASGSYEFSASITNINRLGSWGGNEEAWRNAMPILQFEVNINNDGWQTKAAAIDLTNADLNPDTWHSILLGFELQAGDIFQVRLTNQQDVPFGNDFALDAIGLDFAAIPEPSTYALIGLAGAAGVFLRRKRTA